MIVITLLTAGTASAQHSVQHIDDIIRELKNTAPDTGKMKLLLLCADYYITKQGEEKKDIDSALHFLERCKQLIRNSGDQVWTARYNLKYSQLLREKGDRSTGKPLIETSILFFRASPYKQEYVEALLELANYYEASKSDELSKKIKLYNEAIAIQEKLQPTLYLADNIKKLGDFYVVQENNQEAIKQLKKSLGIYESLNYKNIHEVYDLLGTCYSYFGNYKKAIEYGLKAIETAFSSKDTLTLSTLYNRLGISYYRARHYPEAGIYFAKGLAIASRNRDSSSMIFLILNHANVFYRLDKTDSAIHLLKYVEKNFTLHTPDNKRFFYTLAVINYCNNDQPALARPYYEKLLALDKATRHSEFTFQPIIRYLLASRNFREAYKYIEQFEASCKKNGTANLLPMVYFLWFKADSASGHLKKAIQHYELYKTAEDSLFSEEKTRIVDQLNIEYETAKKDDEIKLKEANITVLNKQQKLQEAEIVRSRTSRNIVITGIVALGILLGLIFNQYRIKKKQFALELENNSKLMEKQTEINNKNALLLELIDNRELLIKEMHHRVKNSLQVAMSLLNTQSAYSSSTQAYLTIEESRQRLYAISLVHQKLYYNETQTLVKMDTYVLELIDSLRDGYADRERIKFDLCIQAVELDVTQAIPVALILNEAVTNSIKHAFPGDRKGVVKVSFTADSEKAITFTVEDDGKGLSTAEELYKNNSMGVQLMQTFGEQLGGNIVFLSQNGFKVTITFKQRPAIYLVRSV